MTEELDAWGDPLPWGETLDEKIKRWALESAYEEFKDGEGDT